MKKVDWSLIQFEKDSTKLYKKLLRENITFHPIFYFFAIIYNTITRFFWLFVYLLLGTQGSVLNPLGLNIWINWLSGMLEVIRRGIWNIIRVENEFLNNVGEFRNTKDIPLPFFFFF
jgi:xenotropic and polytropic retrovirus receptor 1